MPYQPIIALLKTACGCEKSMHYPNEPPFIRSVIQRPLRSLLTTPDRSSVTYDIRVFEKGRVIATGENDMARVVEYNEVLPADSSSWPRIEVHQLTAEGRRRVMNVSRVLPSIDRVVVEVV